MELIADRFLSREDRRVIDLANNAEVFLRLEPAGSPDQQLNWDRRCAALATLRHPALVPLPDYGLIGARTRFEAWGRPARCAAWTSRNGDTGGSLRSVVAALHARGLSAGRLSWARMLNVRGRPGLDADGFTGLPLADGPTGSEAREEMRRLVQVLRTCASPRRRDAVGITIQPRLAIAAVAEVLETLAPAGMRTLYLVGPDGSGRDTALLLLAREARLRGYVPVHVDALGSLPNLVHVIPDAHILLIGSLDALRGDPIGRERLTQAIVRLGLASERSHMVLLATSARPASQPFIELEPLSTAAMRRMISLTPPGGDALIARAVAASAGWPGRFASVAYQKSCVAPRAAMRPAGKARQPGIFDICEGGATPPAGMQRRPNATGRLIRDTSLIAGTCRSPYRGTVQPALTSDDAIGSRGGMPAIRAAHDETRYPIGRPGPIASERPAQRDEEQVWAVAEAVQPYGSSEVSPRPPPAGFPAHASHTTASGTEVENLVDRARQGVMLLHRGRHAAGERLVREAVAALGRRGADGRAGEFALALGRFQLERGRMRGALCDLEMATRFFVAAGRTDGEAEVAAWLGIAWTDAGRLSKGEASLRATLAAAEQEDRQPLAALSRNGLARCLYWQARYEEARLLAQQPASTNVAQRVLARALASRIALAQHDLPAAGAAAGAAVQAARADGADPACTAAAHTAAAAVQAVAGDIDSLRAHVASALAAARSAHSPLRAVRARLTLLDGLVRLARGSEARVLAARLCRSPVTTFPPLLRARLQLAVSRAGLDIDRSTSGLGAARAFIRSSGAVALDAARLESADMDVVQDLIGIVRICQEDDEQRALAHVCATLRDRLRAASVQLCDAAATRPLAAAGTLMPTSAIAQRAAETGLAIPIARTGNGLEAAAPVKFGGATIGAIAARWTADVMVDAGRVAAVLNVAAAACGATMQVALDRRSLPPTCAPNGRPELLGVSPAIDEVRRAIQRAATAPFAVLIEGESGSGKELVARAVHRLGPRRDRAFCALNCAALTDDLIEAELFGHARGAFTGALTERTGLFEEAHGGTLFLDEVAELSPRAQAKLLRAVQEGEIRRIGENFSRRADARLIAATNRPLRGEVGAGRFRQDLYYRLDVLRILVPPLRERVEDVPVLVAHFWAEATARTGARAVLDPAAVAALARYDWPGNVRELQNVMAALAVRAPRRGRVGPGCLPETIALAAAATAATLDEARRTFDRRFVRAALARAGGQRGRAAADLGLSRQGLAKLMARLGIEEAPVSE